MSVTNPAQGGGTALTLGTVDAAAKQIEALMGDSGELLDKPAADATEDADKGEGESEPATQPVEDKPEADVEDADAPNADAAKPSETPELIEVTLPGGEKAKVTLDELRKGYSREADYTRNNMKAAETRKLADQQIEAAKNVAAHFQAEIDKIIPQEATIDWDKLYSENPAEWARWKEHFRDLKEKRAEAAKLQEGLTQKQQREALEARQKFERAEWGKLLEKVPAFADKTRAATQAEVRSYLTDRGFNAEEIAGLVDSRLTQVAWEAAQYRKLQAAKPKLEKRVENLPRVTKPGAAPEPDQVSRQKVVALRDRAAKSGRVEHAAAYIETLLK